MNTREQIIASNIEFGTSGARGLVSEFSDEVTFSYVTNFIKYMEKKFVFSSVAVGIDNRPSSYSIACACALAIESSGYSVEFYGVIPTPALALQSLSSLVPSVMVTGSHIPFDRNGLKFYRPDGEITKDDEKIICETSYDVSFVENSTVLLEELSTAKELYIERYVKIFSNGFLSGKHIGIYEHSSAGRDLYFQLFTELGAKVTSLERSDVFVPIDTEAVSIKDRAKARNWSSEYSFDAIFSTDGDGDRPLVADENGEWLRGDSLGLLCARALNIQAIAIPVSCNSLIEQSLPNTLVIRTRIGSPYVIEAFPSLMQKVSSVAGFEANGGFLLGSDIVFNHMKLNALPTRDSVLPFLMLMYLAQSKSISALTAELPKRVSISDRVTGFPKEKSKSLLDDIEHNPSFFLSRIFGESIDVESIDRTDGLRMTLDNEDIIHLRPSGNAPEFRCYVEATNLKKAEYNLNHIISFLSDY